MRGVTSVILICTSQIINDVEHHLVYLLTVCMAPLEKFKSSAHLLIRLFTFPLLSCLSSFYISNIDPLSNIWYTIIFYYLVGYIFVFLVNGCQFCAEAF